MCGTDSMVKLEKPRSLFLGILKLRSHYNVVMICPDLALCQNCGTTVKNGSVTFGKKLELNHLQEFGILNFARNFVGFISKGLINNVLKDPWTTSIFLKWSSMCKRKLLIRNTRENNKWNFCSNDLYLILARQYWVEKFINGLWILIIMPNGNVRHNL